AGLALLCDCGNEYLSDRHSRQCSISEITVVRTRDGPIRRLYDKKTTPQCLLTTLNEVCLQFFVKDIHRVFNSSQIGIYLICSCGFEVRNEPSAVAHCKKEKCNGHDFTLHKLNKK
ncbi:hypothetical protein PENTCL1PPCAC_20016, partial [Pristionchus entomophagus]